MASTPNDALLFARESYYLGSIIAALFFYFFLTYPTDKKPKPIIAVILMAIELWFGYLFLFTDTMIHDIFPINAIHPWGWHFGVLSPFFEVEFFGLFIGGLIILYKRSLQEQNPNSRKSLQFMFWAIIIGTSPPSISSIILARFNYFDLNWLGPISEIIWIPIIAYSIIRYQQMNVKTIATEVLALAMSVIFFLNIFADISIGIYGRASIFFIFILLAAYLIRVSFKEASNKEKITALNSLLSQKVAEQTVEIRHAYELEKKARRDLEKLNETKDQFIMITQHHLRTPVSSLRWGLEAALKGTYGTISAGATKALTEMQTSVARLGRIVDDFLSITSLKVGMAILNITRSSAKPLLEDVLAELHLDIESRHLSVNYARDAASWPDVDIDPSKFREVILIIIENAVRYNNDGGSINISTKTDDKSFHMTFENTGIGIGREDREHIFQSLFYRSEAARSAHPLGMGVGLSVSRAIVRAHHGELRVDSAGKGKGAKVIVEIPRRFEVKID